MKPLFTVHAGEYLVGEHIKHTYPRWNVWVPSKDTGIDLLVTSAKNRKTVALQVKFIKDFNPTHGSPLLQNRHSCSRVVDSRPKKDPDLECRLLDLCTSVLRGETDELHHSAPDGASPALQGHPRHRQQAHPLLPAGHEDKAMLGNSRLGQRRPRPCRS
jgi:hypothetical protein